MKLPKNTRIESKEYLDYIRGRPCLVCEQPAVPHHIENRGMGQKCDDLLTVPLCPQHHAEVHRLGRERFEEGWVLNLCAEAAHLIVDFLRGR